MYHGRDRNSRTMSAFEMYLRTGKRPQMSGLDEDVEVKFNPWHDPDDGRFTFKRQGTQYARGRQQPGPKARIGGDGATESGSSSPQRAKQLQPKPSAPDKPRNIPKGWGKGGFQGGGGGSFSGGGASATGTWGPKSAPPAPKHPQTNAPSALRRHMVSTPPRSMPTPTRPEQPASQAPQQSARLAGNTNPQVGRPIQQTQEQFRAVERNGYQFQLDSIVRTRNVEGDLQNVRSQRSRTNQAQAGGPDRLQSDDGGHYIAVRFNGFSDTFNHFPQDAGINRGAYRVIESRWAKDLQAGRRVHVKIVPHYEGVSLRPDKLNITWYVDGERFSQTIPNQKKGK